MQTRILNIFCTQKKIQQEITLCRSLLHCTHLVCLQVPHHCGSLVYTLLCPLFLPPGFCLFKVTKILSRGILQKYLRGSPSFKSTFWGTPWLLYNWWKVSIFPTTFQIPFTSKPSQVPYHVPKIFFRITFLPTYLLGYPLTTYNCLPDTLHPHPFSSAYHVPKISIRITFLPSYLLGYPLRTFPAGIFRLFWPFLLPLSTCWIFD